MRFQKKSWDYRKKSWDFRGNHEIEAEIMRFKRKSGDFRKMHQTVPKSAGLISIKCWVCYPGVWYGWGTYFQNRKKRVHFWTFQNTDKKSWKSGLLTLKSPKVIKILVRFHFFSFFSKNIRFWATNYVHRLLSVISDISPPPPKKTSNPDFFKKIHFWS